MGNVTVFLHNIFRMRSSFRSPKGLEFQHRFMVTNLAVADLLLGVILVTFFEQLKYFTVALTHIGFVYINPSESCFKLSGARINKAYDFACPNVGLKFEFKSKIQNV